MAAVPYPGLRTFKTSEAALFFGQEENAEKLSSVLGLRHFVAVVGESGCGKSSLVKAGLVPLLIPDWAHARPSWEVLFTQPEMDPIGNLARSLAESKHLRLPPTPDLQRRLRENEQEMVRLVEASRRREPDADDGAPLLRAPKHLLIVVDQFEELFRFRREGSESQHRDDEAAIYVKLLLNAAQKEGSDVFVVLTMRSEYLGDSAQYYNLAEAINKGLFLLPRMNRMQCEDAIVEPPLRLGYKLPPALVQRLLNEAEEREDGLPLLQHGLRYLWDTTCEEQREQGDIPLPKKFIKEKAKDLIAWSFDEHLDAVYYGLDEARQMIAARIFKLLGERDPRGRLIRRPTKWKEIRAIGPNDEAVLQVLDCFRNEEEGQTFLVPSKQSVPVLKDDQKLDLSHEVLLRQWSLYRLWLIEEEDDAGNYIWLADAAYRKSRGNLEPMQGLELAALVKWRDKFKPMATWAARYAGPIDEKLKPPRPRRDYYQAMFFLKDSEEKARKELAAEKELEQEEKKRLRTQLLSTVIFSVFIVVLILLALYQQVRAAEKDAATAKRDADTRLEQQANEHKQAEENREAAEKQRDLKQQQEEDRLFNDLRTEQTTLRIRQVSEERDRFRREKEAAVQDVTRVLGISQGQNIELTKTKKNLEELNEKLKDGKTADDLRVQYAQLESRAEKARSIPNLEVSGILALKEVRDAVSLDRNLMPGLNGERRRATDSVLGLMSSALTAKLLGAGSVVSNLQPLSAALKTDRHVMSFGLLPDGSLMPQVAALDDGDPLKFRDLMNLTSIPAVSRVDEYDPLFIGPGAELALDFKRYVLRQIGIPAETKATAAAMNSDASMAVVGNGKGWIQFSRPRTAEERQSRQDFPTMKILFRMRLDHDPVTSLRFDRSGHYVIARNDENVFRVIDVANRRVAGEGSSAPILSADLSPGGKILFLQSSSGTLLFRHQADGVFRRVPWNIRLTGPMVFLDDHTLFGAQVDGRGCRIVDVGDEALERRRDDNFTNLSCSLPEKISAVTVDEMGIAALTDGTDIEVIDTRHDKRLLWAELPGRGNAEVSQLAFSDNGNRLLVIHGSGLIQIMDTSEMLKPEGLPELTAYVHALRINDKPRTPEVLEDLLKRSEVYLPKRDLTDSARKFYLK